MRIGLLVDILRQRGTGRSAKLLFCRSRTKYNSSIAILRVIVRFHYVLLYVTITLLLAPTFYEEFVEIFSSVTLYVLIILVNCWLMLKKEPSLLMSN